MELLQEVTAVWRDNPHLAPADVAERVGVTERSLVDTLAAAVARESERRRRGRQASRERLAAA